MSTKSEKDKQKLIQDRCQSVLNELLRDEDNKYCVDCDAKGPRWASWNLGVFLCIRCAGIHRNLGVHISRVKSVNLDAWTPDQVACLQQMGNSRGRAVYEAQLPDAWRRPHTDSSLETFIRNKYQHKRYIAKEWTPPPLPKVNWEREIEEEAEKQRRRKKEKQQQASSGGKLPPVNIPPAVVPAIPKPSSSPKPTRHNSSSVTSEINNTIDLFGLNTGTNGNNAEAETDDAFSSFLSAPPPTATTANTAEPKKGRSAEEESFFNQPITTSASDVKKPLSNDSILALYATQPTVAPSGYPPPMFNRGLNQQPPQQMYANGLPANPFIGLASTMSAQQSSNVITNPKPSDDLVDLISHSLPQQMAGLSIQQTAVPTSFINTNNYPQMGSYFNQQPPQQPPMGNTFTTHLWQ